MKDSVLKSKKNLVLVVLFIFISCFYFSFVGSATPNADWWNDSWGKCRNITVSGPTATLTDYPAYINLDNTSNMKAAGADLRFINASCGNNGSELSFEIEKFDTDDAHIWVKIPSIGTSGKTISVYYNNSGASDGQNATDVWDSNYVLVLHLNETRSTDANHYQDSTSFSNDGTLTDADSGAVRVSGMVAGCIDFDGDNPDHIAIPDGAELDITDSYTLEYWANPDAITAFRGVTGKWTDAADKYHMYTGFYNQNLFIKQQCDGVDFVAYGNDGLSINTWYYSVFQLDKTATDIRVYYNATLDTTTDTGSYTSAQVTDDDLWIGHPQAFAEPYNGEIDELRLSDIARSAGWTNYTYQIIANQGTYVTIGSAESSGVDATGPVVRTIDSSISSIFSFNRLFGANRQTGITLTEVSGVDKSTGLIRGLDESNSISLLISRSLGLNRDFSLSALFSSLLERFGEFGRILVQSATFVFERIATPKLYLLDVTAPTTSSPYMVTDAENITVSFNFTEDGSPITTNVTIDNITIGGEVCEILPV